ncbi:DNA-binding transcriptional MerR regulator [Nocardioides zeae]|uniref:DNA-binding transcriptional MerR regulator n=1 Tax=Nocardioides zeae TaxID=1457234 RepID=A0ACC6IFY3_9ACTN|nr:MerR family transcriptional regulator [Nocardioides zeae]MDR6176582.1 DNA-binding transcriptional MerR regulator [Nocardioides zeae]MDR6209594.1 DNA-binding transcriptional MerR regulator [Nocardioides zeae]
MRIGELAARADVSVRSLRYYEEQGLLTSSRSASGQRHYTEDDVERVRFLQRMYAAGLSSRAIAEVLPCVETPTTQTAATAFERLVAERDRIDAHIAELAATRDALERLIAANLEHRATLDAGAGSVAAP